MTHRILRALPESGAPGGDPRPEGRAARDEDAVDKSASIIRALRFAENAHQVAALTAALHAVRGPGSARDRGAAPGTGTRRAQVGPFEPGDPSEHCDRLEPGDAAEHADQGRRAAGRSAAVKAA